MNRWFVLVATIGSLVLSGCGAVVVGGDGGNNEGGPNVDGSVPSDVTPPPPDTGLFCEAPNGTRLRPGESVSFDCNTCVCDASGQLLCTGLGCVDGGPVPPPPPPDGATACILPSGIICPAGERCPAGDGCNYCVCGPDGTIACTGLACIDGGPPPPPPPPPDAGTGCFLPSGGFCPAFTSCPAGDGCNTCFCGRGNMLSCTERACVDAGPPPDAGVCTFPSGRICPVGSTCRADDGCNTCTCRAPGALACTLIACVDAGPPPPPPDAGPACMAPDGRILFPGQAWSSGCTVCVCSASGTLACGTDTNCGTDGGIPPVDSGVACNSISASFTAPRVVVSSTAGIGTGGVIRDGRYEATVVTIPSGIPSGGIGTIAVQITGERMEMAVLNTGSTTPRRSSYSIATRGSTMALRILCGSDSPPPNFTYTATATSMTWFIPGGDPSGASIGITMERR